MGNSRKQIMLHSTRKAIFLSFITYILGLWISIRTGDWSWFSRSGSLVVIIGIVLTSTQIIENSRTLKIRKIHQEENFHRDYADELKHNIINKPGAGIENVWENGLRGLYMLVSGTFVWGFGDLVGVLFK